MKTIWFTQMGGPLIGIVITGVSKSVIINAMQAEVSERFKIPLPEFTKILLITKGGIITDLAEIERIYVEY
jgi:hypothetical protein